MVVDLSSFRNRAKNKVIIATRIVESMFATVIRNSMRRFERFPFPENASLGISGPVKEEQLGGWLHLGLMLNNHEFRFLRAPTPPSQALRAWGKIVPATVSIHHSHQYRPLGFVQTLLI